LSSNDHGAIFSVVSTIGAAVTDLAEDAIIKLATALHGKFDIFPKGVVIDGQVTKEVMYVSTPSQFPQKKPGTVPVRKARLSDAEETGLPGEQLSPAQLARLKQFQKMHDQISSDDEEDELVSFEGSSNEDLRNAEAERYTKQRLAKMRAEQAGIKG
jgi:hypothetical protein